MGSFALLLTIVLEDEASLYCCFRFLSMFSSFFHDLARSIVIFFMFYLYVSLMTGMKMVVKISNGSVISMILNRQFS